MSEELEVLKTISRQLIYLEITATLITWFTFFMLLRKK